MRSGVPKLGARGRAAPTGLFAAGAGVLCALSLGCGESAEWSKPDAVGARVSAGMPTVVDVSWVTEEPTTGYVEYGPGSSLDWTTPFETVPARDHALTLLGLTAETTYSYRVVTWDGDDAGASEILTFRTGAFPLRAPGFTQEGVGFEGYVVVPLRGAAPAVAILDAAGKIVWYHEDTSGLDVLRARLSEDGRSVLYNRTNVTGAATPDSAIVRVPLDGSAATTLPVPNLAHDFVELSGGVLAAIAVEERGGVRGDAIVEIAASGAVTTVWSSFDCFDPTSDAGDGTNGAWTYANALAFAGEAYYVGLQNFSSIVKVARDSGACEWVLGETAATLQFAAGSAPFRRQSGFSILGDNLFVMDNQGLAAGARVVELEIDEEAGVASESESYSPTQALQVDGIGTVSVSGGDWFVNWGSAGRMELVEDGDSSFRIAAGAGTTFGYHTVVESLYTGDARTPDPSP